MANPTDAFDRLNLHRTDVRHAIDNWTDRILDRSLRTRVERLLDGDMRYGAEPDEDVPAGGWGSNVPIDTVSTTNTGSYVLGGEQKIRLGPGEWYVALDCRFDIRSDTANTIVDFELRIDGETIWNESVTVLGTGWTVQAPFFGNDTLYEEGVHTVQVRYKCGTAGILARMRNIYIGFHREKYTQ
jgi:hypothetical protein